jgi:hypothetical protein
MNMFRQRIAKVRQRVKEALTSETAETAIRLAVVLSIVLSLTSSFFVTRLQSCQQKYSEANAIALRARDAAAQQDRAAWDGLIIAVNTAQNGSDTRAALKAYIDTRAAADKIRAENPLPVPERIC